MRLDEQKENLDARGCQNASLPSHGCSKLVVEFAETLNCESGIVNSSLSCFNAKDVAEYASAFVEDQRSVNMSEANLEGLGNNDQQNWESLIADASDLLIFESPNADAYNESVDPATTFYRSIRNAIQNQSQSLGAVACGQRATEGNAAENTVENVDASFLNSNQKMEYEVTIANSYKKIVMKFAFF